LKNCLDAVFFFLNKGFNKASNYLENLAFESFNIKKEKLKNIF